MRGCISDIDNDPQHSSADLPRRLGSGGFAKVYLIRHKQTHKKFAAKYQKLPLSNNRMRDLVRQEASFLKELSEGRRVVDIHDYYEKGEHSLLVLEYLGVSFNCL